MITIIELIMVIIVVIIIVKVWSYNKSSTGTLDSYVPQLPENYVIVTEWSGEFGGYPLCNCNSSFSINDKTIQILLHGVEFDFDLDNEEKFKKLEQLKTRSFKRGELLDTLKQMNFSNKNIYLVFRACLIDKFTNWNVLNGPENIAVDNSGNVYVADGFNHCIQKFDSEGNFNIRWGSKGNKDGQFEDPWRIAIDPRGYVYVVDFGNYCIQKFDANGNFKIKWGSKGDKDGQFYENPCGIAIDTKGYVYISDIENIPPYNRIQKFDSRGNFITKYYLDKSLVRLPQELPCNLGSSIAIDNGGNIFINLCSDIYTKFPFTDEEKHFGPGIIKYSSQGEVINCWGTKGSGDGEFSAGPKITTDLKGNIFTLDSLNHCIQIFTADGKFITKWGDIGFGEGEFLCPGAIAVDPEWNVYVMDTGNLRVQKFSPVY